MMRPSTLFRSLQRPCFHSHILPYRNPAFHITSSPRNLQRTLSPLAQQTSPFSTTAPRLKRKKPAARKDRRISTCPFLSRLFFRFLYHKKQIKLTLLDQLSSATTSTTRSRRARYGSHDFAPYGIGPFIGPTSSTSGSNGRRENASWSASTTACATPARPCASCPSATASMAPRATCTAAPCTSEASGPAGPSKRVVPRRSGRPSKAGIVIGRGDERTP